MVTPVPVVKNPKPLPYYWSLLTVLIRVPTCALTVPGTNPYIPPANNNI